MVISHADSNTAYEQRFLDTFVFRRNPSLLESTKLPSMRGTFEKVFSLKQHVRVFSLIELYILFCLEIDCDKYDFRR